MVKKYALIILVLLFNNYVLAGINVSVDKTKITDIDHLQLTINISNLNINNLNISELDKDFTIINQSKSSSFNSVNGKMSSSTRLQLQLEPKRIGKLIIPAFIIDNERSNPINIKVSAINENDFDNNLVFIKSSVNKTNPMVQEQVIYTIGLYAKFDITNTKLNFNVNIDDAIVKKIKDSKVKKVDFEGKKLWLKKFNFAIYPQKTAKLIIPKIKRRIAINYASGSNNLLLFAKAVVLNVGLPDKNYPNDKHWLPATDVKISGRFNDKGPATLGETLTREISLEVTSQITNQLPELTLQENEGLQQYLDTKVADEIILKDGVKGIVKQTILIIPDRAGKQTIPAVKIYWFDLNNNKTKLAVLPEVEINVKDDSSQAENETNNIIKNTSPIDAKRAIINSQDMQIVNDDWKIIAIVFIILWLFTSFVFLLYFKNTNNKRIKQQKHIPANKYLAMVEKYAKQNNAKQTKFALEKWLVTEHGIINIDLFANKVKNKSFNKVLFDLQQCLYNDKNIKWDGKEFWQIFVKLTKKKLIIKDDKTIPNLYPSDN